jgi:hypothetical protein
MRPSLNLMVCSLLALCSAGCVSVNSYVENGHNLADFRELHGNGQPQPVRVVVDFKTNGKSRPVLDQRVANIVIQVLSRTNVLMPVSGNPDTILKVVVDDRYDADQARGEGMETGMTFGAAGVLTRDDYHFFISLQGPDGKPRVGSYRHAMITVAGRAAKTPPSYGQPLSADAAFDVIVKQSILEFLANVQQSGDAPVMFVPDSDQLDNQAPRQDHPAPQ